MTPSVTSSSGDNENLLHIINMVTSSVPYVKTSAGIYSPFLLSYVGHQSTRQNTSKPHPPTLSRPITPLLPLLPYRPCTQHSDLHLRGNEVVIGRPEKRLSSPHPLLHLIKQNLTDTEVTEWPFFGGQILFFSNSSPEVWLLF